jgi:hypothetical protein
MSPREMIKNDENPAQSGPSNRELMNTESKDKHSIFKDCSSRHLKTFLLFSIMGAGANWVSKLLGLESWLGLG